MKDLVSEASKWKFSSNPLSSIWNQNSFDDSLWKIVDLSQINQLSRTTVQYFRYTFENSLEMAAYELGLRFQYGLIAYLSGVPVVTENIAEGYEM